MEEQGQTDRHGEVETHGRVGPVISHSSQSVSGCPSLSRKQVLQLFDADATSTTRNYCNVVSAMLQETRLQRQYDVIARVRRQYDVNTKS